MSDQEESAAAEQAPVLSAEGEIEHVAQGADVIQADGRRPAGAAGDSVDSAAHEGESAGEEAGHAEGVDHHVHAHGVGRVFGAAHAGFDQGEAALHEHHQEAGQERPDVIQGPFQSGDASGHGIGGLDFAAGLRVGQPGRGGEGDAETDQTQQPAARETREQ